MYVGIVNLTTVLTLIEVRYMGVRKRPKGKYEADITNPVKKVCVLLGILNTKEEAGAYDNTTSMYRGPNTKLNFPTSNEDNLEYPNKIDENLHHELNLEFTLAPSGSM
uniref:Ethylene-responsive element binding protein 5 n=1 Tax=Solanum tuberosum TaxID=4113 RepID=M1DFZ6_SOLTU